MFRAVRTVLVAGSIAIVLATCSVSVTDSQTSLMITIDSLGYLHGSSYDFGSVNPDDPVVEVEFSLANLSSGALTVIDVSAGAFGLTMSLPPVPFEIAPGSEAAGTLAFDPSGSRAVAVQFHVTVEDASGPFMLNATGEGNYPPTVEAVTVVSGAGSGTVNGTYVRTEETVEDQPVYRHENTAYLIYFTPVGEEIFWVIDDDLDPASTLYRAWGYWSTAPNCDAGQWTAVSGDGPGPGSVGEIETTPRRFAELSDGDVLRPSYRYSDEDGDNEGDTLFQWYRSDSTWFSAESGTYSPISGETAETYEVDISTDDERFFKVLVTPVAADGTLVGEPVWFGPTSGVNLPYGE